MNNFKAISIAGLLVGSMSANAAFVLDLPESMTFDIADNPSVFEFRHELDLDENNPDTFAFHIENTYGISGGALDALPTNQTSFIGVDPVHLGLQRLLFGRPIGPDAEGNMRYEPEGVLGDIETGVDYSFSVFVQAFLFDLTDCPVGYSDPTECAYITNGLSDTMTVRFVDELSSVDVPVGPTAPLLAAGLAGLFLRRKK